MLTTGQTIEKLIKEKGLNQSKLARKIGVHPSSVSQWVSGKTEIDRSNLLKVATALDVSVSVLLGETAELIRNRESSEQHVSNVGAVEVRHPNLFTEVPFLSAKAQAGPAHLVLHDCHLDTGETHPVLSELLDKRHRYLVMSIDGHSMEPELRPGTKVLSRWIEGSQMPYESGGVYVVLYADRLVIKRIRTNELRETQVLVLHSDNEQYGRINVPAEEIQCMWRVLFKIYEPVR